MEELIRAPVLPPPEDPVNIMDLEPDEKADWLMRAKMQAKGIRQVQGLEELFETGSLTFVERNDGVTRPGGRVTWWSGPRSRLEYSSWRGLKKRLDEAGFVAKSFRSPLETLVHLYIRRGVNDEALANLYSFFT